LKNEKLIKMAAVLVGLSSMTLLSGCAAIQTEVDHHALKVNSKMSNSIFLPPEDSKKPIFVDVHNTSSEQGIPLKADLISQLKQDGYQVDYTYHKTDIVIQANILQAGQVQNQQELENSLSNGFGGALAGSLAGSAISGTGEGALVGGGIGAVGGYVGGLFVKDVTYSLITDVEISVPTNATVDSKTVSQLQNGSSMQTRQTIENTKNHTLTYKTRIVSYADQVNLKFETAASVLSKQMATEIANIF
jgi:outer membrane lipoprotein SlyB